MPTFTALTTLAGKTAADSLGDAMERLDPAPTGVGVIKVEDGSGLWEVGGYFTHAPDPGGLALLAAAFDARPFAVSELPDRDWVAHVRRELTPVEAGRFFVHGSHDAGRVPGNSEPLLIEAAMAFGTGHHGTTLGCLRALDQLLDQGVACRNIADIGCGTAVLAMAAARVWRVPVLASDMDQVAVEVAAANVAANGLSDRVLCARATGFEHPELVARAPFDLVFANILKGPLIDLSPDMGRCVAQGGYVILSGILIPQADEVVSAYSRFGFTELTREEIGEWATLTLRKSGVGDQARDH